MEHKKELFIDIDRVLKSKNPKLYKTIPKFLINYLKRIVHQDELNYIIDTFKNLSGLDFNHAVLEYFNIKTSTIGRENVPDSGRFILAANHPIGGIDGMIFIQEAGKIFGPTKSIINDLLMNIENLAPLFVGVNKHGKATKAVYEEMDKVFSSDVQVLIFPAGLASRRSKGLIQDLEWKKTFISKAIQYKRDIIPVHISGRLSNFFYNFANIRKMLGVKANLEMLYLADETFKQKNKSFEITFGKPIAYPTFDKSFTHQEWAQKVKKHVYKLREDKDAVFSIK